MEGAEVDADEVVVVGKVFVEGKALGEVEVLMEVKVVDVLPSR